MTARTPSRLYTLKAPTALPFFDAETRGRRVKLGARKKKSTHHRRIHRNSSHTAYNKSVEGLIRSLH
jgi:hypothetical protein